MNLVVHEEPGLQKFDKNLLEVIAVVDAPLSLTFHPVIDLCDL
jgi:hypothetical protein